ncbi:MAG: M23 family metallopeptidase [Lachnospiraceae bacterium]|nr:M23 family metallopeptidase [Lachnospiraceae bacterium]
MKSRYVSSGLEGISRYLAGILGLVLCLVVEWEILDRFTENAYTVRYQEALEQFRQSPGDYFRYHHGKEDYDTVFAEQLEAVRRDLNCFPVEKSYIQDVSYVDSWYGERTFGGERRHEGTDIMSIPNVSGEIPVISMTDGKVKNIGWLRLGGWRIGIESETGIYYYYAHLHSYATNLKEGDPVYAGQLLGFMGDSGYGEEGTTGMFDVHLHVGIYFYDAQGREISMNPYSFLQELQGIPTDTWK